jgi:AbrB family looped-hinge helix DNA binding protein
MFKFGDELKHRLGDHLLGPLHVIATSTYAGDIRCVRISVMSDMQPEPDVGQRKAKTGRRARYRLYSKRTQREKLVTEMRKITEMRKRVRDGLTPPATTATMRARGGITLPAAIRELVSLQKGDQVIVSVRDGQIVLTPAAGIPRDQQWFWTKEWQAKEAEADADLASGRVVTFDSDEAFLAALDDLG